MIYAAFPDWHATIEDVIAEGDKVVHRIKGGGTLKDEWMGIAATDKQDSTSSSSSLPPSVVLADSLKIRASTQLSTLVQGNAS